MESFHRESSVTGHQDGRSRVSQMAAAVSVLILDKWKRGESRRWFSVIEGLIEPLAGIL